MKVYKFGGASVKNAEGVRNLRKIIDDEQNLFIIVSAMGKTTNALERVFGAVQKMRSERARFLCSEMLSRFCTRTGCHSLSG